jgi:hypothetical protein
MARGISINIGVASVDDGHYLEPLDTPGAEEEAQAFQSLAAQRGFETKRGRDAKPLIFLSENAKISPITDAIRWAAGELNPGDILVVTFSGHGVQFRDCPDPGQPGQEPGDEDDGKDEAWCLFDKELLDDQLAALWACFRPGVRILVISDSCNSGTVDKLFEVRQDLSKSDETIARTVRATRGVPRKLADRLFRAHRDEIRRAKEEAAKQREITASVLLLAACEDAEFASAGLFAKCLLDMLKAGSASNYLELHEKAYHCVQQNQAGQHPSYDKTGSPNPAFELSRPLVIG